MVSFTFNGQTKPVGYLSTTVKGRDWATMHVNDVRRLWGGHVFDQPVFGAQAAMVPDPERAAAARQLMQEVFDHAERRLKPISRSRKRDAPVGLTTAATMTGMFSLKLTGCPREPCRTSSRRS